MKKQIGLFGLTVVLFLAAFIIGCGGDDEAAKDDSEGNITIDTTTEILISNDAAIVDTYFEGMNPTGEEEKRITLSEDCSFEGNAWDVQKSGTYEYVTTPSDKVVFTFADGTEEEWSVIIGMGEPHAIVNSEGEQYSRIRDL